MEAGKINAKGERWISTPAGCRRSSPRELSYEDYKPCDLKKKKKRKKHQTSSYPRERPADSRNFVSSAPPSSNHAEKCSVPRAPLWSSVVIFVFIIVFP